MAMPPADDPALARSPALISFFDLILRRRLRGAFNGLRLALPGIPPLPTETPLIVYCNHASWWDAAFLPVLMWQRFPDRRGYAPIDAAALARYPFMRRLGFFGIEMGTYSGSARFLRTGRRLLERGDTLLGVTPEGGFHDPRRRPVRLRPGLAALLAGAPQVTVLPIALEYPFWTESKPEALACVGEPWLIKAGEAPSRGAIQSELEDRLACAMDRLADHAMSQDPARFETVLFGGAGVGGVYDAWRRLKAFARGERFDPAHRSSGASR